MIVADTISTHYFFDNIYIDFAALIESGHECHNIDIMTLSLHAYADIITTKDSSFLESLVLVQLIFVV